MYGMHFGIDNVRCFPGVSVFYQKIINPQNRSFAAAHHNIWQGRLGQPFQRAGWLARDSATAGRFVMPLHAWFEFQPAQQEKCYTGRARLIRPATRRVRFSVLPTTAASSMSLCRRDISSGCGIVDAIIQWALVKRRSMVES
jgi:hypothetical protein